MITMSFLKLLNKTCTIQTKSDNYTTNADGTVSETWANTYTSIPCRIDKLGSTYNQSMGGLDPKSTHILFLESSRTIARGNRVIVDSITYFVLNSDDPTGKGHHLECEVKLLEV